jgi:hypothetical protein
MSTIVEEEEILRMLRSDIEDAGGQTGVGAHHLSRKLQALGHDARLMPAKYVRPYSKGQKNDFRDAEAIAEAVQRPTMKFVATNEMRAAGGSEMGPWSGRGVCFSDIDFLRGVSPSLLLSQNVAPRVAMTSVLGPGTSGFFSSPNGPAVASHVRGPTTECKNCPASEFPDPSTSRFADAVRPVRVLRKAAAFALVWADLYCSLADALRLHWNVSGSALWQSPQSY